MAIDPVVGGALIGAGANVISNIGANRAARKWNEKMYSLQKADNMEMWNMQNAYNDPAAQMARLEKAGLNPNLVYGTGAVANQTGSPPSTGDVKPWNPRPPEFDISQAVGRLMQKEQIELLKAQTDNTKQDGINKAAQTLGITAGSSKSELDYKFAQENYKNVLQQSQANTLDSQNRAAISSYAVDKAREEMPYYKANAKLDNIQKQLSNDLSRTQRQKMLEEIKLIGNQVGLSDVELGISRSINVDNKSLQTIINLLRLFFKK